MRMWKLSSSLYFVLQVQQRVDQAKEAKEQAVDLKDETVRGGLPLFKLRSKEDRLKWQKLVSSLGWIDWLNV